MYKAVSNFLSAKVKTTLFKNSFWGILSNIFQNILFSIFFIVIARKYSTTDFANYVIANTLYAFVVAFSSLGLGQWFIRELMNTDDKKELINKFFKIQIYVGVVFYAVDIVLSLLLYKNDLIRSLSLLIGINVIFDNIIYVIKYINIAQFEQRKTFVILTIEALLKFFIGCLLFISPIPILFLSFILIALRFVTLNLFIRIGSSKLVDLKQILKVKVAREEVKKIVAANWSFIVIGSVSIVYWRIGNILVSKILTMADVANYEISFKLFSMAEILPVIVSSSIYPLLIKSYNTGVGEVRSVYKKAFLGYCFYGLLAFTFIYSFSDFVIPFLFGKKYIATPLYCKEMFLTILVFPTALLQANVLIAMKLEKLDMWFNITSLVISLLICAVGFYYFKSLSVVNYAIFISFLVFHIIQDVVLIKRKISTFRHVLTFYVVSASILSVYYFLAQHFSKYILFFSFWSLIALVFLVLFYNNKLSGKQLLLVRN